MSMAEQLPERSEETHQRFLANLERSVEGVWTVARWMYSLGYTIEIPTFTRAPTHQDWLKHVDGGVDFYATKPGEPRRAHDVKWLTTPFSSRYDWPHNGFIVNSKLSFDRADPPPYSCIALSDDKRCVGIVLTETSGAWRIKRIRSRDFYICSLDLVSFVTIADDDDELPVTQEENT